MTDVATGRKVRALALLCALAIAAAACSSGSGSGSGSGQPASTGSSGTVTLYSWSTEFGRAVGATGGNVAYMNKDETGSKIVCTHADCTATWHPLLTGGTTVHAGPGVQSKLIGTVTRPNGAVQMTYGGHPLYLYAHSAHSRRANAQGAGGVWYAVGTDGKPLL